MIKHPRVYKAMFIMCAVLCVLTGIPFFFGSLNDTGGPFVVCLGMMFSLWMTPKLMRRGGLLD